MKTNNSLLGKKGEKMASDYLEDKGFTVLERNFRCPMGEIDLIARDKKSLVFIEVKLRRTLNFGHPLESVTKKKQDKIRQVAKVYLSNKRINSASLRFDVISILMIGSEKPQITHLIDVF